MRIAVIGTDGFSADSERQRQDRLIGELCLHLSGKGHEVDLFTHPHHKLAEEMLPGVNIVTHRPTLSRRLRNRMRPYDVVNSFGSDPVRALTAAQHFNAHRSVISLVDDHQSDVPDLTATPIPALQNHAVTVSSRRLERQLADAAGVQPIFIPQGVDHGPQGHADSLHLLENLNLHPDQYLLYADAIIPESGIHHVIAAANKAAHPRPLVIVETQDCDESYRNALWELSDPSRVMFLGKVAKPLLEALVAHTYLYVAPSAAPRCHPLMVHALALGRAVVVSDAPDNLEVVGPDAFTFSEGDPADLTRVLSWLQADVEVVKKMQARAQSICTRYAWLRVTSTFEEIYEALSQRR